MKISGLAPIESKFADIIWAGAPMSSGEVVRQAAQELDWKRTTTYTVLKRLCDRGLFENRGGTVHALISRQEFYAMQSERFVEESFQGSLPAFLAAFSTRRKLTPQELEELEAVIGSMRGARE
ncbi:MAG: BlaI/MecI/CopY family transcriptional regulator [Ruminococcaceae bacterium]|nr:BlaI/MecI/CopY family transcriptional regulator [Oscillospiraceae bacterium]